MARSEPDTTDSKHDLGEYHTKDKYTLEAASVNRKAFVRNPCTLRVLSRPERML